MSSLQTLPPDLRPAESHLSYGQRSRAQTAYDDLVQGLLQWRIWWVLSFLEIRQRYRRSLVGQFWVTLSMVATIVGIGVVFGAIFNQPLSDYLPFLGVGIIVWGLLAGLTNDLASAFISSETYLRSYPGPRSIVIYRTIARNFIGFAHNVVLIPILLFLFGIPLTGSLLLTVPAMALIACNAVWLGMLIGPLSARFRDLPQLVANITQLAFFVTPIMFRPAQVQDRLWALTHLNPFASFVEILRAPILGTAPGAYHWIFAGAITVLGFAVAIPFYARFRGRIVYWL